MSENCNHDCNSCASDCDSRTTSGIKKSELHSGCLVKKVIGVVSGKGGVGKSMITSMLAVAANRAGKHTAIMDADITGPSIPKTFGITQNAMSNGETLMPVKSEGGIDVMSINLLLKNDTDPVVWRGPVIAGTVQQFWTDVIWQDIDVMFVDMPPGTGDVPLTVFQSLPVDGIVIVTTPQELVSMIVSKAVKMANAMNIPVLGIVENMSYFKCSDCGKNHNIFGESHIEELAKQYDIEHIVKLPIEPEVAANCDNGTIEKYTGDNIQLLSSFAQNIIM